LGSRKILDPFITMSSLGRKTKTNVEIGTHAFVFKVGLAVVVIGMPGEFSWELIRWRMTFAALVGAVDLRPPMFVGDAAWC
jgi:hypothetical protein